MAERDEIRDRSRTVVDQHIVPELMASLEGMPNAENFYVHHRGNYVRMDGRVYFGELYDHEEGYPISALMDYDWNRDPAMNQTLIYDVAPINEGAFFADHLGAIYSLGYLIEQVRAHPQAAELAPVLEHSLRGMLNYRGNVPDFTLDSVMDLHFSANMLNRLDFRSILMNMVPPLSMEEADAMGRGVVERGMQDAQARFAPVIERMRAQYPHLFNVPLESQESHAQALLSIAMTYARQGGPLYADDLEQQLVRYAEEGMPLINAEVERAIRFVPDMDMNITFRADLARMREDIITASRDNPEAALLIENDTRFMFNLDRGYSLSNQLGFAPVGNVLPQNLAAGIATPATNTIHIDYANLFTGDFSNVWREEVGHMVDGHLRRMASENAVGVEADTNNAFISHDMLPESVVRADIARLRRDMDMNWTAHTTSDNYEAFMSVVNANHLRISGMEQLPQTSYRDFVGGMHALLNLQGDLYNHVRETGDDDPGNQMRDSEVMVKFHVLRQYLEELNASIDSPAQLYSSDTPVLEMMATLAPGVTQIYREQWLPMVNAAVALPAGELRNVVLSVLSNGSVDEYGLIDATDMAAIREAAERAGVTIAPQDNAGGFNDSLIINDIRIRVQFTHDAVAER